MPQLTLQNASGAAVETIELEDSIFGVEVRPDVVHSAVVAQLAAKRLGTHHAKTRGEVSGGGRKPYRQKGTGRARQGSTRAPQWRGGGVVFPPGARDYSQRLPRKVRRLALFAAWSDHAQNGSLIVVDDFALAEPKTRVVEAALRTLVAPQVDQAAAGIAPPAERPEGDTRPGRRVRVRRHLAVLLDSGTDKRAFRNLATLEFPYDNKVTLIYAVHVLTAPYASVYDLALADVVIATRAAIERVTAEFAGDREEDEA